jgi:Golgi SNAP receptor complex protein 2
MNSLYTSGVRQTSSLQADLERLRNGDHSAALLGATALSSSLLSATYLLAWLISPSLLGLLCFPGQISASLAAMHRTIDDYDTMAKREIIKSKQEKAQMFVAAPSPWFPKDSFHC